jgi:choline dehydrogenase-like flavoprotein
MNDHVTLLLSDFKFNSSASQYIPEITESELESSIMEYLETGGGDFGELQAGPQVFFASTRAKAEGEEDWADGRIWIDASCPSRAMYGEETKACFGAELQRPKSMGNVKLNVSAYLAGVTDFVQLADIDFNGFSVASDLDVILEAIELIFKVVEETKAFQSLGAEYTGTPVAGCEQFLFKSREYWTCYTQQLGTTAIHMVGTCAMGNGLTSVTDSKMR